MGKIITLINITTDGFCDSQYVIADAEFHGFVHGLLADAHSVAFGRGTFELFQGVWPPILENSAQPEAQVKMAQALNDIDKIVFSSQLRSTTWPNSTIVKETRPEELIRAKQKSSKNLLTIGSPGLVATLTKLDLVDEYYFSVQPKIAGGGKSRLFEQSGLNTPLSLKFVESLQLGSGVNILHYYK